jgi:hypothetical protein
MGDCLEFWRDLTWLGRLFYAGKAAACFGAIGFVLYVFILGLQALLA